MKNSRWVKPMVAFSITFGVMAMGGSLLRVFVVYRSFFDRGMLVDDPTVATEATRELSRLDHLYTPTFLLVAVAVSLAMAAVFAWRRPKPNTVLPPPMPGESSAESR